MSEGTPEPGTPEPEVDAEELAAEGDAGYEPDTTQEPDQVAAEGSEDPDLPPGDSGEFDGSSIDENEAPGEAQPDEPIARESE